MGWEMTDSQDVEASEFEAHELVWVSPTMFAIDGFRCGFPLLIITALPWRRTSGHQWVLGTMLDPDTGDELWPIRVKLPIDCARTVRAPRLKPRQSRPMQITLPALRV